MNAPTEPDPGKPQTGLYQSTSYDYKTGKITAFQDSKACRITISRYDDDGRLIATEDIPEGAGNGGNGPDTKKDNGPEPDSDPPIIV
jgi:hypothetical protein